MIRYENLLLLSYRFLASNPYAIGTSVVESGNPAIRRLPLRNLSQKKLPHQVRKPRHVIFYRIVEPDMVVIIRILHDQMDIVSHLKELDSST